MGINDYCLFVFDEIFYEFIGRCFSEMGSVIK